MQLCFFILLYNQHRRSAKDYSVDLSLPHRIFPCSFSRSVNSLLSRCSSEPFKKFKPLETALCSCYSTWSVSPMFTSVNRNQGCLRSPLPESTAVAPLSPPEGDTTNRAQAQWGTHIIFKCNTRGTHLG